MIFSLKFLKLNHRWWPEEDSITLISKTLNNTTQLLSVPQYASKANMSLRNFERRFTEQVGIPPKLYAKLLRFNEAMKVKLIRPQKSWTAIAYECGYFDQMHFIKEFKQFAAITPTQFTVNQKKLTGLREDADHQKAFNSLPQVKFVVIKRTDF